MSFLRRAGAQIGRLIQVAADPAAEAARILLYPKDVAGASQLFARNSAGVITQLTPAVGGGNIFVWEDGMSWSTVYATVNDGHPWIVLVERPSVGAFRTMTKEVAGPTNLWNLQFVAGFGQAYNGVDIVHIRTEVGLTIGVEPINGFAKIQSTNIKWEFFTASGPIATGVPVAISIDGGRLQHNNAFCFETDQFLCELKNNALLTGSGGSTALVRLLGDSSILYMTSWASMGASVFATTTGAKVLNILSDWTVTGLSGAAIGAGITAVYQQNQAHAISPDGTLWTLEVDNTGTLIIS